MVITIGKSPESRIRLRSDAKPYPVLLILLCPLGRTVEDSVFVGRKAVFFGHFSAAVKGCDLKCHSRHAFLSISVDLSDAEITAHHPIADGCIC